MSNFTIDFFELSFLAEACIPPRPIAREMFWQDLIKKHYHKMSADEKSKIFTWMNTNIFFIEQLGKGQEDVVLFHNRFNPDNQFIITYDLGKNKEKGTIDCFLNQGQYKTSKTVSINEKYITDISKISIVS